MWNERVRTESLRPDSCDVLFGDIALDSLSRDNLINGGVFPQAYDVWNGLVRNKKAIKKPIIFNLFDKIIEYDGHYFPLKDDPNANMREIENSADIYYG